MKQNVLALLLAFLAMGCAHQPQVSLSAVGPAPQVAPARTATGTLVVYSAWRKTGTDDPDHRVHSDYDLLTPDGNPLLHVRNFVTPIIEDPATVPLDPGRYIVKARVQRYGFIQTPVVIESGKITALYLDDTTKPGPAQADPTEKIQLPDGRVVGWASR